MGVEVFFNLIKCPINIRIDLMLTVIVGWLGLIIGRFFGEDAMQNLQIQQRGSTTHLISAIERQNSLLARYKENIKNQFKDQKES